MDRYFMFYFIGLILNLFLIFILKINKKIIFVKIPKIQNAFITIMALFVAMIVIPLIIAFQNHTYNVFAISRVGFAGLVESLGLMNAYIILKNVGFIKNVAMILISWVFAFLHYWVFNANYFLMLSAFVFGLICIYASVKANSYFPCVIVHLIWNIMVNI